MPWGERLPNHLVSRRLTKLGEMRPDTRLSKASKHTQARRIVRNVRDYLASVFVGHGAKYDHRTLKPTTVTLRVEDANNLLMALDEIDEHINSVGRALSRRSAQGSLLERITEAGVKRRKADKRFEDIVTLWLESTSFLTEDEVKAVLLEVADRIDGSYLRGSGTEAPPKGGK